MREDRRKRYDDGFRHEALGLIKAGAGKHFLARRLAMPVQTAEKWIMKYRSNGEDAVMGAKGKRSYDWGDEGRGRPRPRRQRHDQDGGHGQIRNRERRAPGALVSRIPYRRARGLYFVKSRWTLSALNLNTFGVQLEHRRRLVPCFVVCLVYFMRECLFR